MADRLSKGVGVWIGRLLSAVVVLFLLFDGGMSLFRPDAMHAEMQATGFADWTAPPVGLMAIASAILYALPRTTLLGAILATGFLGGAICAHFRTDGPGSPPQLISLALGLLVWGGLYLRDARLRALLPLRRGSAE